MSDKDQEMEFALKQERISAAISGFGFDEEAFRQAWLEVVENGDRDGFVLRLQRSRNAPISPEGVKLWNPMLNDIRDKHDFRTADITALSTRGIVFVNDLLLIPKDALEETYNSLPTDVYPARMTFEDFKQTILDLKRDYPKAHEFLAQPIREGFVGRSDGGRTDGSSYLG